MKKIKFLSLVGLSIPLISIVSCDYVYTNREVEEYNEKTELTQNVFSIKNNKIFEATDFKNEENIFIVKSPESFKEDILKQIETKNIKEKVINNWSDFLKKYSKILDSEFLEKHHVIYYSNYDVRETLDSVKIDSTNVIINYITYGQPPIKSLTLSQYFIILNKNQFPVLDKVETNNIKTKLEYSKYKNELPKDNPIIYSKS